MKKSFKADGDVPEVETPPVDETALAEIDGGDFLPAGLDDTASMTIKLGQVSGDIGRSDLKIPRFAVVQSVGPLSGNPNLAGGDLVLNETTVLANKDVPISVIVLECNKTYEEDLPYDANGPRPRQFKSRKEVLDAGLWVEWRNDTKPPVREVGTVTMMIRKPDALVSQSFPLTHEGVDYAIAMWTVRKTAYAAVAKKIFSASAIELAKGGLLSGVWTLSAQRKQINGNWVFVPQMQLTGKTPDDLITFIKERLG
jgi:hypothetical protein